MPTRGIQVLPSGFESLAQGIQQLGAGLGQSIFSDEQRQRAFVDHMRANPEVLHAFQEIAWTSKEAQGDEGIDSLAAMVDLDRDFVQTFADSFSPSLEHRVGVLESNNPEIVRQEIDRRGVIRDAEAAEARYTTAVSDMSRGIVERQERDGIPQLMVNAERARLLANIAEADFSVERMNQYQDMLNAMPEGHLKEMAIGALVPEFVRHVQFHEQMEHEERLAAFRLQQDQITDPRELFQWQWDITQDMTEAARTAISDYEAALAMSRRGEEGRAREGRIRSALAQLERVHEQMNNAVMHGYVLPTNTIRAELEARGLSGRPELRIFEEDFENRERTLARALVAGEIDIDAVRESPEWSGVGAIPIHQPTFQREFALARQEAMDAEEFLSAEDAIEGVDPPAAQGAFTPRDPAPMNDAELEAYVGELQIRVENAEPGSEAFRLRQELGRARRVQSTRNLVRRDLRLGGF